MNKLLDLLAYITVGAFLYNMVPMILSFLAAGSIYLYFAMHAVLLGYSVYRVTKKQ